MGVKRAWLGPDESHTQPDRVSGSFIKWLLGGGPRGVLTYQPLQTCLSPADPASDWGGLSQATRRPTDWSQLSGLSAGERGILNSSVMLTEDGAGGRALSVQGKTQSRTKAVKSHWFGLSRVTP